MHPFVRARKAGPETPNVASSPAFLALTRWGLERAGGDWNETAGVYGLWRNKSLCFREFPGSGDFFEFATFF